MGIDHRASVGGGGVSISQYMCDFHDVLFEIYILFSRQLLHALV